MSDFDREAWAIASDKYNEKRQWIDKEKQPHIYYGSCWWVCPPTMVYYTEKHLETWTDREVMKMHYYLTKRLDGYGHLSAHDSIKHNCNLFREVLRQRGIDGINNVQWNETFYDWGYRHWRWTASPIKDPKPLPEIKFVKISL